MELIVASRRADIFGASSVSIKPGNIILNWRKLIGAILGMALTGAGAATSSWFIVLGALVILRELYSISKIELSQMHAATMIVMWENHDGRHRISEARARELIDKAFLKMGVNQTNEETFARIVDDLTSVGCIQISNGEIWLREWISRDWP